VTARPSLPDLVVAGIAIALGLGALALLPSQIPGENLAAIGDMRSPAFFPILSALLLVGAGVALLPAALAGAAWEKPERPLRAAGLGAFLVAGALAAPLIGGLAAIFILMVGTAVILGARRPVPVLLLAAISTAIVHGLFERTLKVLLPAGRIFGG